MTWTPKPPPQRPACARQHCRFYEYTSGIAGGPQCAAGVDMTGVGVSLPRMPFPTRGSRSHRQEWTAEERAAWAAWRAEHDERLGVIMTAIPSEGFDGSMPCPGCGIGMVRWSRARYNRHLHAGCTTPHCFRILQ